MFVVVHNIMFKDTKVVVQTSHVSSRSSLSLAKVCPYFQKPYRSVRLDGVKITLLLASKHLKIGQIVFETTMIHFWKIIQNWVKLGLNLTVFLSHTVLSTWVGLYTPIVALLQVFKVLIKMIILVQCYPTFFNTFL